MSAFSPHQIFTWDESADMKIDCIFTGGWGVKVWAILDLPASGPVAPEKQVHHGTGIPHEQTDRETENNTFTRTTHVVGNKRIPETNFSLPLPLYHLFTERIVLFVREQLREVREPERHGRLSWRRSAWTGRESVAGTSRTPCTTCWRYPGGSRSVRPVRIQSSFP